MAIASLSQLINATQRKPRSARRQSTTAAPHRQGGKYLRLETLEDRRLLTTTLPNTTMDLVLVGGSVGPVPQEFRVLGSTGLDVTFEGAGGPGDANDDDLDGLDEVASELTDLNLVGGGISVSLNNGVASVGEIEENVNNNPGLLDVDPFAPGTADSFFDVFLQIDLGGGLVVHNNLPIRTETVIDRSPPHGARYLYDLSAGPQELLDDNGNPTGIFLMGAEHFLGFVEVDQMPNTQALIEISTSPTGANRQTFLLNGSATAEVFFEGIEGAALDNHPADGFDEVQTELVAMNLSHPSGLTLSQNPSVPSLGEITELTNGQPGTLDVSPFGVGGAQSVFDVHFELDIPGVGMLHNSSALTFEATIFEKPPFRRYVAALPSGGAIELVDANGNPSGVFVTRMEHRTGNVEIDVMPNTQGLLQILDPSGNLVTHILSGDMEQHVFFEGPNEGDAKDDDNDGFDEVDAELFDMNMTNGLVTWTHDPLRPSLGFLTEQTNGQPGTLDVAPFGNGPVDAWFDMFMRIDFNGQQLTTPQAIGFHSVIFEKPQFRRHVGNIPARRTDSTVRFGGVTRPDFLSCGQNITPALSKSIIFRCQAPRSF